MATIRESDLPGIGRKFQVETRSGEILVIIVHDTGPRALYHIAADAPDAILSRIELDDPEARQVAGIMVFIRKGCKEGRVAPLAPDE